MEKIKNGQIKYIHILKSKLNLKDENYRVLLESKFNKKTSKDLSSKQAEVLIKILEITSQQLSFLTFIKV